MVMILSINWEREAMKLSLVQRRCSQPEQEESIKVYLLPPNVTARAQRGFRSWIHSDWIDDELEIEIALDGV